MGDRRLRPRAPARCARRAARCPGRAAIQVGGAAMTFNETAGQQIPDLAAVERRFLVAGAIGAGISLAGWVMNPAQFYQSYLMAYMLVLGATLGCLALGM